MQTTSKTVNTINGQTRRDAIKSLLALGCCCLGCMAAAEAAVTHTVMGGDTLSDLAKKFGVSVEAIMKANNLKSVDTLSLGQKLVIPAAETSAASPSSPGPGTSSSGGQPAVASKLQKALDAIRIRPSRWRYVVIHHSGTSSGDPKGMDAYHRRRGMENGLAYHFVIGNGRGMPDGTIAIGHRWKGQLNGGHLASEHLNAMSIGICLVGDFQKFIPTRAQMRSLAALSNYLLQRCKLPPKTVKLHREINTKPTLCPGRYFPKRELMLSLS